MKQFQTLRDSAGRLSPREGLFVVAALATGFIIAAVYGVMLPGQAAARSAADRNARAAIELAEARDLAARIGTTSTLTDEALARLAAAAAARGLNVLDSSVVDGAAFLRLTSPGSVDALAWAAEVSSAATLASLSITSARGGGVDVDASFGGAS